MKNSVFVKNVCLTITVALMSSMAYAKTVWVDVRTPEEYQSGHVLNAKNLPLSNVVELAKKQGLSKEDTVLLYCRSGRRSALAQQNLQKAGYQNVQNLGGFEALKESGAIKVVEPKVTK